jgi:hypothetical protein
MDYNQISPTALSNQNTISSVFGQTVPGTFNRNMNSAESQITVDPLTGRTIDPTANQSPYAPVPPPTGVQQPITPTYDLNSQ